MFLTFKLYSLGKIDNGLVDLTSLLLHCVVLYCTVCLRFFFVHWENEATLLKHALRVCIAFLLTYSESYRYTH